MEEVEQRLKEIKKELYNIYDINQLNRNRQYALTNEQVKLQFIKNSANIKKCYKHKGIYHMIISPEEIKSCMKGPDQFNEYVYQTLAFKYPKYNDDDLLPFHHEEINLCRVNPYEEISYEEFMRAFAEVNNKWLIALKENRNGF